MKKSLIAVSMSLSLLLAGSVFASADSGSTEQLSQQNQDRQKLEEGIIEHYPFETDDQRRLFKRLTEELRCPKCQNQNIADSNAGVAVDLKNKTYQLVKEGKSKQYVIDYMIDRYGNFVHYQPPFNWITIWLWLLPGSIVVFMLISLVKRKSTKSEAQTSAGKESDELMAQVEDILASKSSDQSQSSDKSQSKDKS